MHIYLFVLSRRTNQNTDVSLHLYHILTRFWSLLCSCCTRVYLLCSSGFPSLQPFTTTLQRQEDIHTMTDFSLTLLPGELLLHILEYCSDDVNTLCALDATCLTVRSLTNSFWESLASHKFGSVTGACQMSLLGRPRLDDSTSDSVLSGKSPRTTTLLYLVFGSVSVANCHGGGASCG